MGRGREQTVMGATPHPHPKPGSLLTRDTLHQSTRKWDAKVS